MRGQVVTVYDNSSSSEDLQLLFGEKPEGSANHTQTLMLSVPAGAQIRETGEDSLTLLAVSPAGVEQTFVLREPKLEN